MDNNELKDFFEEMRNPNANLLLISENKLKKLENCKIEKEKLEESLNKMIVLNQNLMNEINNNHIVIKNLSNSIDILSNDIKIVNNDLSILKNENINNKKEIKDVKDIANTTKIINENIVCILSKAKNELKTIEKELKDIDHIANDTILDQHIWKNFKYTLTAGKKKSELKTEIQELKTFIDKIEELPSEWQVIHFDLSCHDDVSRQIIDNAVDSKNAIVIASNSESYKNCLTVPERLN